MSLDPGIPETNELASWMRSVEERLASVERNENLSNASIGQRGLTVKDGGTIRLLRASGDVATILSRDGLTVYDSVGAVRWESTESRTVSVPPDTTAKTTTSSSSFQTVATLWLPYPTPVAGEIAVEVEASAPGTEGEVRFYQDSEFYPGTEDITNGSVSIGFGASGGEFTDIGGCVFVEDGASQYWPGVIVKVRRTAGAGTVSCRVIRPGRFS